MSDESIVFSQATFDRHRRAIEYVEEQIRTRAPIDIPRRRPGLAPGAWGLLESGHTISAVSGLTLGSGTVKLCDRSGTPGTPPEEVTVYNPGPEITGPKILALEWTSGDWTACTCEEIEEDPIPAICCPCFSDPTVPGGPLDFDIAPIGMGGNDLTLTLNAPFGGQTTFNLVGLGSGSCAWEGACFHVTGGPNAGYYKWTFIGVGDHGYSLGLASYGSSSTCPGSGVTSPVFVTPSSPTAYPFSMGLSFGSGGIPFAYGVTSGTLRQGGPKKRCFWRPEIFGCFGAPVAGALVEIKSGATTLVSALTEADGRPALGNLEYTDHEGEANLTWSISLAGYTTLTGDFSCRPDTAIPQFPTLSVSGCCQKFLVYGCRNLELPGATVNVRTSSGGTILASGVTDANGAVVLTWPGSCTQWVEVTHPTGRFAANGSTLTMTSEDQTQFFLTAASGYHCAAGICNVPLSNTLQATDPNGTWTSTYNQTNPNGAGWYACATKTSMASVVTAVGASPTCTKTVGTGSVKYTIKLPAAGSTIANYWGHYNTTGQQQTSATPTCASGTLTYTAGLPAGCTTRVSQATATAGAVAGSCPPAPSITATMPATGTAGTANPGAGALTITE